jgi:hypothetical protein
VALKYTDEIMATVAGIATDIPAWVAQLRDAAPDLIPALATSQCMDRLVLWLNPKVANACFGIQPSIAAYLPVRMP